MNKQIALYARVSSEKQVQANTISSQLATLKDRIQTDGHALQEDYIFVDDGHSGSTLMRPALERLRDSASNNEIKKIYIHSPDRLARKYAYQCLLIEELNKLGVEIIFLNNQMADNPESDLLLQIQGVISEYERTKIMERSRRGKLHAARQGEIHVMAAAPYGYKYISKRLTGNQAAYEIVEEEAEVVNQLFKWVGIECLSLNEVTRRLADLKKSTRKGKKNWDRGTILHILKNPTYKGLAAFGKTKIIPRLPHLREYRNRTLLSKRVSSVQSIPRKDWISIPVPAIISEELFETVQKQLEENKKRKREKRGAVNFLLSGLIVCKKCQYSYSGNGTSSLKYKYGYYICVGGKGYCYRARFCNNKSIRSDLLEDLIWRQVIFLLTNSCNLEKECERRLAELDQKPNEIEHNRLVLENKKIQNSISRLIDIYAEGLIEKEELKHRTEKMKLRLTTIEQRLKHFVNSDKMHIEAKNLIAHINDFSSKVRKKLDEAGRQTKRNIMKALIRKIEVSEDKVNVVFKIPFCQETHTNGNFLGDCCRSNRSRKTR